MVAANNAGSDARLDEDPNRRVEFLWLLPNLRAIENFNKCLKDVVARGGIEPPTRGFSVRFGSRASSDGQLQLLHERFVARIVGQQAQESVGLDVR